MVVEGNKFRSIHKSRAHWDETLKINVTVLPSVNL